MTETKTTARSTPVVTGIATEEQTYATRYKQGGRTVYSLALTPSQLVNMVPRPDPNLPNPGNRAIRPGHAKDFAEYYLTHDDWVIPSIILRAPSIFMFNSDMEPSDGYAQWGVLSYPKRSQSSIQILDGQHRILGFHLALQMIAQKIESARDFRARALKAEHGEKGAPAVREAEAALRAARALEDRFSAERVTVDLQITDDTTAYRQMFYDIAENALGITASVKLRFDTRKVVNRALPPVLEHPLFAGRIDLENDRVKRSGPYYAAAKHVGDIIRAAQVGIDGRIGKVMERTLSDQKVAKDALEFLNVATEAFPQLAALQIGQVSPETLRDTGLLGSPAILRVLAGVHYRLRSEKHQWTREQVLDFFKVLNPHMAGPAHAESIWMRIESEGPGGAKQKAFNEGAFAPNGRRQDLAAVEDALVDWAILGEKGAPWVWAEPAPIPALEKTEDEIILEAQIEADPVLATLLADQAKFTERTQKTRAKKK